MSETVRLGGMALANGVLVHGPEHWACAIRDRDGRVRVASGRKPFIAAERGPRSLQGPLKLAEIFALLPVIRRRLPEATLAFAQPRVAVTMGLSAAAVRALRMSRLTPAAQETLGALASLVPAAVALRGTALAEYHGAEHVSIGSYEHGERREREHERCGSHLVGPLLLTSAAGGLVARRVRGPLQPLARIGAAVGAVTASVEVFGWMTRNREHPLARALARPGNELQHRLVTAEPSAAQLEVANAALSACLELEDRAAKLDSAHGDGNVETPPPT
jgi:Protein of unknown function (DUF1385)